MKLIYRIALRLSAVLLPLMALWAALFYMVLVDEINDEVDDVLEERAERIIERKLAGRESPAPDNGFYGNYSIVPLDEAQAVGRPHVRYDDTEIYNPETREHEAVRMLTALFCDADGRYYELKTAVTTFEKDDLLEAILGWMIFLYVSLLLTTIGLTMWTFHRSMQPLYALLRWFDDYLPGCNARPVPCDPRIEEFRRLGAAAQRAADRSEHLFEQQKQFIGNASHELQTPLAVLGNRIEWLLDATSLGREQTEELLKMQRTLRQAVRLNRTLLLLTKIDNGQFPESADLDLAASVREQIGTYGEVYASRRIVCRLHDGGPFPVRMNESLAAALVANLLRNAYVHTAEGGTVEVALQGRTLTVANDGAAPLDADRIFERFYQGAKREGSTGLGLALVAAVARYYGLRIEYRFAAGRHRFSVVWPSDASGKGRTVEDGRKS